MEKKYKKIEFERGSTVVEAVLELIQYAEQEEFVCGDFNGRTFYSDTVSIDSAYLEITGLTYFEELNNREVKRQKLIKEEGEYQETIEINTKLWVEKGREILEKEYWTRWDECVPVRLSDLYHGMELKSCLDIVVALNNGEGLEVAKAIIEGQNHSGMSFGLVLSMVKVFCKRGEAFAGYIA